MTRLGHVDRAAQRGDERAAELPAAAVVAAVGAAPGRAARRAALARRAAARRPRSPGAARSAATLAQLRAAPRARSPRTTTSTRSVRRRAPRCIRRSCSRRPRPAPPSRAPRATPAGPPRAPTLSGCQRALGQRDRREQRRLRRRAGERLARCGARLAARRLGDDSIIRPSLPVVYNGRNQPRREPRWPARPRSRSSASRSRSARSTGPARPHKVEQKQINLFADATGDHQFIHVDPERAAKLSPYKVTIAHGFLTLSLLPFLQSSHPAGRPRGVPGPGRWA